MIGGRYRLDEPAGLGGMSSVWRAADVELERTVAVKILARDADRPRFEREARALAGLAHPNVCRLWDYGESEDGPYMVLEYLPGGTLEDRLAPDEPLPDEETRRIAAEVAAGLAAAHDQGLVHRDLKPANVLFDEEGRAKVADFGIARLGGAGTITEAGTIMGTAAYLSPEQAEGRPAGPASDVYSFGVILHRMLTGRLPFEAEEALTLVSMHATHAAPAVEDTRADAPADLAALAAAAMRKDPDERPQDGAALVAALGSPGAAAGETIVLGPPAAAARPPRRLGRALVVAAALLLLAAAGAALALVAAGGGEETEPTEPTLPTATLDTNTGQDEEEPAEPAPTPTQAPQETATQFETETRTQPATTAPPPTTTAPDPAPTEPPPPPPAPTEPPGQGTPPTTAPATTTASDG